MHLALARDADLDLLDRVAAARLRRPRRFHVVAPLLLVVLAAATVWWWRQAARDTGHLGGAPLVVSSTPAGATILVDGHDRGGTPATVPVPPGAHQIVVRHPAAFDAAYRIDAAPAGAGL